MRDLAEVVYEVVSMYSLYDLQEMRRFIDGELEYIPEMYRKNLYPKMIEQIYSTHNILLCMHRDGTIRSLDSPLDVSFGDYCTMIEEKLSVQPDPGMQRYNLLYYLLSAFNLFVLMRPGHPVGTPLPGGLCVEKRRGWFYCPVKQTFADIKDTLCHFCIARPSLPSPRRHAAL
jgi:uncharacterized protein (UPF0305 family)